MLHPLDASGRSQKPEEGKDVASSILAENDNTTADVKAKSLAAYSKNSKPFTSKTGVYLDIVPVQVLAGGGVAQTYALLDTGSDRTFCERRLAQELGGRKLSVKLSVQTISSKQPCVIESFAVSFDICSLDKWYH